jgi:CHRD domain
VATAPSQGVPPQPGPSPGTTVPGTVNVPAGTQACPPGKGTLTGTIRAADILGAPVQGIQSGDLAAAAEVLGSGQSYAQIHTKLFTPGEVRGQIEVEDERENES